MREVLKTLETLHTLLMERSKLLWPEQGQRAKGLGFTKQRLFKLENNGGEGMRLAKLPTLIKVAKAIAEEEEKRLTE